MHAIDAMQFVVGDLTDVRATSAVRNRVILRLADTEQDIQSTREGTPPGIERERMIRHVTRRDNNCPPAFNLRHGLCVSLMLGISAPQFSNETPPGVYL
ncbi:hypothetical protein [Bradyrhizobium sp. 6(2017)]|uniref:hypothetical protein n=1 Tax=Bradyrhizobium sp. 6(2017) TaxID=1197460 RepID=UPI0013E1DD71|nr:hypothetical protein [Bradyrhizobium sp. 6(2017)]QIG93463.1 hypothetical protein G6P99_13740 [Bradyrhizobium sp. 6(2017)]